MFSGINPIIFVAAAALTVSFIGVYFINSYYKEKKADTIAELTEELAETKAMVEQLKTANKLLNENIADIKKQHEEHLKHLEVASAQRARAAAENARREAQANYQRSRIAQEAFDATRSKDPAAIDILTVQVATSLNNFVRDIESAEQEYHSTHSQSTSDGSSYDTSSHSSSSD
jgi:chromosome segregation ATPase